MNDTELDPLLETWSAPAPPESLRDGLRARLSRGARRASPRSLRWAFAVCLALLALGAALARNSENRWDLPIVQFLNEVYGKFIQGRQAQRAAGIAQAIRDSDPKMYVDGQLAAPPDYAHAVALDMQVPGDGEYSITFYSFVARQTADGRPTGWVEAGRIHDNVIEFQAGARRVRIECNKQIVDQDRPVFVLHRGR